MDEVEENEQKYQDGKIYDGKEDDSTEDTKKKTTTFWNDLRKKLKDGDIGILCYMINYVTFDLPQIVHI